MSILSDNQKSILTLLSNEKAIGGNFYLSGGTALAEFYLQHRWSEDLDFFSEKEVDPESISATFKKIQPAAGIETVTYEQSFNRNLFFLKLADDSIKTEFTYYPFPRIEVGQTVNHLKIDSLLDIAVNKLFTIYQKPRSRDFIDLYSILKSKPEWDLRSLTEKAQIKFDHYLDPLQLSAQFVKSETLKDYPKMIAEIPATEWQTFFLREAESLSSSKLE
ncbi:MAG: nucleotidyl transferase AbiEii/AbiGii toxin family protein [Candidatus Vogelbacteria bacterium]|nr:nucleotidyl transferase AbiEii/AbiGii toxin family protein [Candidatus Vogelbacteria bacterium]